MPHTNSFELQMLLGSMLGCEIPAVPSGIMHKHRRVHISSETLCVHYSKKDKTQRIVEFGALSHV